MMKIRGWLLAAAMIMGAQSAMATDVSDIFGGGGGGLGITAGAVVTEQQQQTIAAGFASVLGADVVQAQLIDSSGGTLLTAVSDAVASAPATVVDGINNLLAAASTGDSGALSVLSGTTSTAASEAAGATASAIGGGGGVISGRQSGLMAERKAMGNVDSALASFKMNQNFANRVWASPFYTRQNMDENAGQEGYSYSAWGASVGYDHVFGAFVAGGALTYNRGDFDIDNVSDDTTIDNYGFSLYGQYYNTENGVFVTAAGGYNYGDNTTTILAGGDRYDSENDTDSYWLGANVGRDFFVGENWTVTPSIGLFWSQSETSSYTELMNGAANRNFGKAKSESLMMPIDLKVEHMTIIDDCSSLSVNVAGGYSYNWKSDGGRSEGSWNYINSDRTVFVQGVTPKRSSWNLGAGVTYRRNNFDVGLNYRYDGKSKFDGHRVAATFGWNF